MAHDRVPKQNSMENNNIQLTLCAHRDLTAGTVGSLENLRLHSKLLYTVAIYTGDALIGRTRSRACTHFLERKPAPYMLFIDDDIEFLPEHVERIYLDMKEGYDLIGGCYAVKDESQLASYGWHGGINPTGGIVDVEYVGTGFMGISWKCLDTIQKRLGLQIVQPTDDFRCYPFFESGGFYDRHTPIYISEDWDFCLKARKADIRSYMDMAVWVGHRGTKLNLVNHVFEAQQKEVQEAVAKEEQELQKKEQEAKDADSESGNQGSGTNS